MTILELKHLKKYFSTVHGTLHAVDDVSFRIEQGSTVGVVGESGCGKSTLGRTILNLLEPTDGTVVFKGEDITRVDKKKRRVLREHMQMIFQDPYSSLNPRMTASEIIREPLVISRKYTKSDIEKRLVILMDKVGLAKRLINSYPHELDGGRRQRICIARALALDPDFIVCDEPVSALDVSIQAQILNLMQDLQQEHNLTYVFITHDLAVVRHISDEICVMYLGQVVEKAKTSEIFDNPLHPYTKALLSAIPVPDIHAPRKRILLRGEIASPVNPAPGCRFAKRCIYATEECKNPQQLEDAGANHLVSCCRYGRIDT